MTFLDFMAVIAGAPMYCYVLARVISAAIYKSQRDHYHRINKEGV